MWFAAAVLFAVLAAGIIIYRAANDDIIRTASNDRRHGARTIVNLRLARSESQMRSAAMSVD
jgi:hypothetical protein